MYDNLYGLVPVNKAALGFNFTTLGTLVNILICVARLALRHFRSPTGCFLLMFLIEYHREAFFIQFLEVDQDEALDHLPIALKKHIKIRQSTCKLGVSL